MDQQYIGRYRITGKLGRGGMGSVVRAVDEVRQRDVAIKLPISTDPEIISRLQRECDVLAQLEHHHIVQMYGSGSTPDLPFYIVMEYIDGETVEDLLRQHPGGLEPRQALKIAQSVAEALVYAHKPPLRVIHRDIKPSNILIRQSDGVVKVTDFGIAAVLSQRSGSTVIGTMAYVAPEQVSGLGADERSDLYSLGALLYEMLTGQRPPQVASAPARPPSAMPGVQARLGNLAASVDYLTLGLLEGDPNRRRPQRAADVVAALTDMLEGRPTRLGSAALNASSYDQTIRASRPPSIAFEPPPGLSGPSGPPISGYGTYLPPIAMPPPPPPFPSGRPAPGVPVVPVAQVVPMVPVRAKPPSSGKAIASLVLGIFAVISACVVIGGLPGVLAVIFGHLALGDIRRSGGRLGGHGSAIAGLVLGYVSIGLALLVLISLRHAHTTTVINLVAGKVI